MAGGAVPTRAVARLVPLYRMMLACTALAGLFIMHGVAVGLGCPGVGRAAESATAVHGSGAGHEVSTALHIPAPVSMIDHEASVSPPMASVVTDDAGNAGGHGALCMSLPPQAGPAGLLALLLGIGVVAWTWPAWGQGAGADGDGHRRRAPPPAGSCLLTRLCVSRT
ncbi:hypothetical protein [Protofrankia symbiont of Coriaria ruscifolia]|uniref:Putative membrane protein n=1 Tax=Candidatus Protofrankia californiensis TaxID=1839754 RepID=A0A1C3PGP7_9ACTN|nr:hypothetical protein [Protofrankia symbiont of Coriaria ruscifolia]SBW28936.1 putative membrane protein [Candidatus Protofrankia californiensis]